MAEAPDLLAYRQGRMDPLAVLERHFVPDVVRALDERMRELAQEAVEQRAMKPWLTVREAAVELGCSTDAIRARARRGRLESRYQGRRLYISAQSILDLGAYPARATTNKVAPATRERPGARTRKD